MPKRTFVALTITVTTLVATELVPSHIGIGFASSQASTTWARTAELAASKGGAQATSAPGTQLPLGVNAPVGRRALAPDSPWNTPIDHLPVDPQSTRLIASMGADAPLHPDFGPEYRGLPSGIPYVVVGGDEKRYPVIFDDGGEESDHVLYPIPVTPPVEGVAPGKLPSGDGDRHMIVIDRDNSKLYELYAVRYIDGRWHAGSGAVWDLFGDTKRPRGWTSADAAGLPIFPGLVRYDEAVERAQIDHALRFTVPRTRRAFTAPASHYASRDENPALPPMGVRVRLKATVDVNAFPVQVRPILVALKRYGMILADNGGPFYVSGVPDTRWSNDVLDELKKIKGRDFEVVQIGSVVTP